MSALTALSPDDEAEIVRALAQAADQFNRHDFWECHETLEPVWLKSPQPIKTFLQGLIQTAAGLHHLKRGNRKGTLSLLGQALDKLHRCEPEPIFHRWIRFSPWLAALDALYQQVSQENAMTDEPPCLIVFG